MGVVFIVFDNLIVFSMFLYKNDIYLWFIWIKLNIIN